MMVLSEYDKKVLAALGTHGALLTKDVAASVRPMFGNTNRMHSAAVRSWLLRLEHMGLVCRLDDNRPTAWMRASPPNAKDHP